MSDSSKSGQDVPDLSEFPQAIWIKSTDRYSKLADWKQFVVRWGTGGTFSVSAILFDEELEQLAPVAGRALFDVAEQVSEQAAVVALLGIILGYQYSTRKQLNHVEDILLNMDTARADGGRRNMPPRDEKGRFKPEDGGDGGGGMIGGAIAGAAIGSSGGPGGTIAGAIIGALLGDEIEKRSKDSE